MFIQVVKLANAELERVHLSELLGFFYQRKIRSKRGPTTYTRRQFVTETSLGLTRDRQFFKRLSLSSMEGASRITWYVSLTCVTRFPKEILNSKPIAPFYSHLDLFRIGLTGSISVQSIRSRSLIIEPSGLLRRRLHFGMFAHEALRVDSNTVDLCSVAIPRPVIPRR